MKISVLAVAMILTGCGTLPRDAEGTSERIHATAAMAVGVPATSTATAYPLVHALSQATGATARVRQGETEPLLVAVETGKLDLAVAWFDEKTPWADRVALGPPLATRKLGGRKLQLRAAARNGENRWIMLVERTSRQVAGGGTA